ncbi:Uncharacterized protein BM_BM9484 [Brugia malayi]|uniref:Bm9484 n=1 Tax=Brugia malayi TaxID=6279 RepID=A0A0K0JZG1_BRUMA|nr:Uncharacterized protein BM_BM9484 [Brugia malayi]CRZ23768.1 Bm9484 [Brugia malayi]VIO85985.1 Uncharacterized protein BM_BM9484 [Brugia malayi]
MFSVPDKDNFENYFNIMICNKTYDDSVPFRNELVRRTYSSIRCSRQTQRTQLKSTENRSLNKQQYMRQECRTISEEYTSTGRSFTTSQNNEQHDTGDISSCVFVRGPTQLRDSRRKTAEQWQIRKHSPANGENCVEEVRYGQKVKFSPSICNESFRRNLKNTVQNKESHRISVFKHPECTRTHLLPSLFSSSIIGLKSKSRNFESNSDFIYHSDSSYPFNKCTKPSELLLKSAGLHEIHVNISAQNQNPLNEKVC